MLWEWSPQDSSMGEWELEASLLTAIHAAVFSKSSPSPTAPIHKLSTSKQPKFYDFHGIKCLASAWLGIENQDHLGAVEKLGVNVESRSAGTENAVASAPRSKKRQKRRIAPTLVSGNAQAPPVRSKVAIVKEPLKIGALSVQEIDHSLGSLCVFVAASLARCLETDGLPLRNVQRYCDVIEALVGAAEAITEEMGTTIGGADYQKSLSEKAPQTKGKSTASRWRERASFLLFGVLVQSSITHVSVVRRLVTLAVAISPARTMASTLLASSLASCTRRVLKWNEIRMMSAHAAAAKEKLGGKSNGDSRTSVGFSSSSSSGKSVVAMALEKEAATTAAAVALAQGAEVSSNSANSAFDHHWQSSADLWLLEAAYEKRQKAALAAAESEAEPTETSGGVSSSEVANGNDIEQQEIEERVLDERRAALSRVTAAARANGLAIAREFQKLQKAYNRGYGHGDMFGDDGGSDFDGGSETEDEEGDEDYGGRRHRRRRSSRRRHGNGKDGQANRARSMRDDELLQDDLRGGRRAAWQFCQRRITDAQRAAESTGMDRKYSLDASNGHGEASSGFFRESGFLLKLPKGAQTTVPAWELDNCTSSTSADDEESSSGSLSAVPPLPLVLPTPSVWAAVLTVTLSKVQRLFTASANPLTTPLRAWTKATYPPPTPGRKRGALSVFFAGGNGSGPDDMDDVGMSASATALAAQEEAAEMGEATALSALAQWRPLLRQLQRLVTTPRPFSSERTGDQEEKGVAAAADDAMELGGGDASGTAAVVASKDDEEEPFDFDLLPSAGCLLPSAAKAKLVACLEKLAASARTVAVRLRRQPSLGPVLEGAARRFATPDAGAPSFESQHQHQHQHRWSSKLPAVSAAMNGGASLSGIALLVCLLELGSSAFDDAEGQEEQVQAKKGKKAGHEELRFWFPWLERERTSCSSSSSSSSSITSSTTTAAVSRGASASMGDGRLGSSTSTAAAAAAASASASEGVRRVPEATYQSELLLAELVQLRLAMLRAPSDFEDAPRAVAKLFSPAAEAPPPPPPPPMMMNRPSAAEAMAVDVATRGVLLRRLAAAMEAFSWDNGGNARGAGRSSASSARRDESSLRMGSAYLEVQSGRGGGDRDDGATPPWKKRRKKRLRSRNRVIDDWLGDEHGDDAYADLEDFIVS
jgi:hypothetical protein